jgi:RND family efflux transporter MFP subunit
MKNWYRGIVLVLILGLIGVLLFRNKETAKINSINAKQIIDLVPVRVVVTELTSNRFTIMMAGKVEANSEIIVISKANGTIDKLSVGIGSAVNKNDEIARLDDFYSRQEYDMAKKAYDQIKREYNRYFELAELDAVTGQQLEKLKLQLQGAETKMRSMEKRLDDFIIRAPTSGIVNQLFITEGGALGQGMPVCELIGNSGVQITSKLPIDEVGAVSVGNKASMTTNFDHGITYPVYLSEVGIKNGKLGGVPVKFSFENDTKQPPVGSYCSIKLEARPKRGVLIPIQSLVSYQNQYGIFVVNTDRAQFVWVEYDYFNDEYIILKDTLLNDKKVVTEGAFLLEHNDRVKIVEK